MKRLFALAAALALVAPAADFTYEQRSEVTGGSMKQMMAMLGRFSKGASGPQTSTTYISGGKMATHSGRMISITDAQAGTITSVDLDKKEYSVMTFEEMVAAMKKMSERMSAQKSDSGAQSKMKVSLDDKGPGKTVAGVATRNMLMKVDTDMTMVDKKSGKEVTTTTSMENDMHVGKTPGSEAFQEFAKAMQGRFPLQQMPMQALMQGGVDMEGMKEAGKKMAEIQGIPLYSVMRMSGAGMPGMPPPQQQQPQGNAQRDEAARQAAGSAAESATAGRMGRFGGLAGLGRRAAQGAGKPQEQPQSTQPAQAETAAAGPTLLMEMTTEVTSFSNKPVDASVFAVPAGFKQVDSPMKKMAGQ